MPAVVIVGAQWGDEGKGKITDYLAQNADVVVRYQGGNNAGHTIVVGESTYKFHLIPSGILHKEKLCVLGNGVVIDTDQLIYELDHLPTHVDTTQLKISDQAHFILPTHKELDAASESRKGDAKIGTTGRGIGPAYRDKMGRNGIRMGDPADKEHLRTLVEMHLLEHKGRLSSAHTVDSIMAYVLGGYARLKSHITNTPELVNTRLNEGGKVLLEGAQGTLLDIDHGTYPFVTSSNPTAGGACIGSGLGPTRIGRIVGVTKAYTTRVGSGPFVTELPEGHPVGDSLRKEGHEFGTTTGRPRRCGWIDLPALRYAVLINGMTHMAITKLDVLDHLNELKICTAYKDKNTGEVLTTYPTSGHELERMEPVLETVPGWKTPTTHARSWADLPPEAAAYITRIEDALRIPAALVSVGADRTATFSRLAVWEGL